MSVVETPILLRADVDKNAYRGEAMSQLRILKHEMALGGLTTSVRTVRYPNGVVIQCRKSFEYETVDIFVPKSLPQEEPSKRLKPDFFAHPRSGNVFQYEVTEDIKIPAIKHGGYYLNDGTFYDLTSYVAYPSVDDDHGTFVLAENKDKVTALWAAPTVENYGNCWWTSEDSTTLSWKGNPSKQFPIGASFNISGLTRQTTDGYTVFDRYIYSNGVKLCEGPAADINEPTFTLVVGACYTKDSDDKSWLLCLTVSFINSAYILHVWRSDDTGKTWQLLNEFPSLRAAVTAFISQDGRRFVYGGQLYQIDAAVSSVVAGAKIPTSTTGTRTIHGAGGYGSTYRYEGVRHIWPSLSKETDGLAYTTIKEEAAFGGTGNGDTHNQTAQVPVYRGNPATAVTIRGGFDAGFTFVAEFSGSYCSIQWSGVDRYQGTTAWKAAPDGCNTDFTVSVTLMPQGVSDTYTHTAEQEDMTVSGPASASVGTQYSANHAISPITWSISSGAISESGLITALPNCDTSFSVTAVDLCGRSATLNIARELETLTVSGPQTDVTQGQYSASGAAGSVSWSVTQGSISDSGYAVFSGCGTVSVTATDSCGRSASLSVKLPTGKWCLVQYDSGMRNFPNDNLNWSVCTNGGTRVEETWLYHGTFANNGCTAVCYDRPSGTMLTCYDGISRPYTSCGLDKNSCAYVAVRYVYMWLCSTVNRLDTQTIALPVGTRVIHTWG